MTDTVQKQIRDAAIAALNQQRPSDVPEAVAGEWFPGEPVRDAELHVYFHQEDARPIGGRGGATNATELLLVVQPVVTAEDTGTIDDTLEVLRAHIAQRLGDTNLGGLVTGLQYRGTQWKRARMDLIYGFAAMVWIAEFQTARADIAAVQ